MSALLRFQCVQNFSGEEVSALRSNLYTWSIWISVSLSRIVPAFNVPETCPDPCLSEIELADFWSYLYVVAFHATNFRRNRNGKRHYRYT